MIILPPPPWFTETDTKTYLESIPINRYQLRQNKTEDSKHVYCLDGYARTFREYRDKREYGSLDLKGYVECKDFTKKSVRVAGTAKIVGSVWFFMATDSETSKLLQVTSDSARRVGTFRHYCALVGDKDAYDAWIEDKRISEEGANELMHITHPTE